MIHIGSSIKKRKKNMAFKSPVEELECRHWQMEDGRDE